MQDCDRVALGILNPSVLSSTTADADGNATFIEFIPESFAGRTVLFQALERGNCKVGNLVEYAFP